MTVDTILQVVGIAAIALMIISIALSLTLSEVGWMILFATAFTLVIAIPSFATFLMADFLFPESVASAGWTGLLWLIVPASLASVILFDFLLDEITPRSLRGRIQNEPPFKITEAAMRGFFVALMLVAASRLVPDAAGVSVGAAISAGMFATFVRYYLGLYLDDSGDADLLAEEFAEEFE